MRNTHKYAIFGLQKSQPTIRLEDCRIDHRIHIERHGATLCDELKMQFQVSGPSCVNHHGKMVIIILRWIVFAITPSSRPQQCHRFSQICLADQKVQICDLAAPARADPPEDVVRALQGNGLDTTSAECSRHFAELPA